MVTLPSSMEMENNSSNFYPNKEVCTKTEKWKLANSTSKMVTNIGDNLMGNNFLVKEH